MQRSSADLHRVPPRQRRQLGLLLSPVAAVLLVAGVLLAWLAASFAGHLVGALVTLLALALLGVGYGLLRSARADEHERRLDEAIRQATGPCGADCGTAGCAATDCAVKALPRR
jgi:Flp pilus assembly protein TadB